MSSKQNVLTFPAGLPGLPPELNRFAITALSEGTPFFLLQSLQDDDIGFILLNPFALFPDYEFELPDQEAEILGCETPEQVAVFCIVNASRGLKNATVNLLAPVVFNTATGMARQVVLNDKSYSTRQPLSRPVLSNNGEDQ